MTQTTNNEHSGALDGSTCLRDVNGREVMAGDLIRVPHYRDRSTRRKCFMHKLVARCDDKFRLQGDGDYMIAIDVGDIWRAMSVEQAHSCRVDVLGEFEIIDGLARKQADETFQTWYERPKHL